MRFLFITSLILCGAVSYSFAQQYLAKEYKVSGRLNKVEKNCLFKSNNDVVLLGSSDGLFSFDGNITRQYLRSDGGSNNLLSINKIGENSFLCGYDDGCIGRFDRDSIKEVVKIDSTGGEITSILVGNDGMIWIAAYGTGLFKAKKGDEWYIEKAVMDIEDIYDMDYDEVNDLLYLASDDGIVVINNSEANGLLVQDTLLKGKIIKSLSWSPGFQKIVASTFYEGIFEITNPLNRQKKVASISLQSDWVGSIDQKVISFDISNTNISLISEGTVKSLDLTNLSLNFEPELIFHDKGKLEVWVWCKRNGLVRINLSIELLYNSDSDILCLTVKDENMYLGTNNGIIKIDSLLDKQILLERENVIDIEVIPEYDEIWCATLSNGVIILKDNKVLSRLTMLDGLPSDDVLSIKYHKGYCYIGTLGGLVRFDVEQRKTSPFIIKGEDLSHYIYTSCVDRNGDLWLGMDGEGVFHINKNGAVRKYLMDKTVFDIQYDKDENQIWLVVEEEGICYYDNKRDTITKRIDYDLVGQIWSLKIHNKSLYFTSENGFFTFNPAQNTLSAFPYFSIEYERSLYFNSVDVYSDDHVVMSMGKDLWSWQVDDEYDSGCQLNLLTYKLGKTQLVSDNKVYVSHSNNLLHIEYQGLDYDDPSSVYYKYQLTRNNDSSEWRYTRDQSIIISDLQPGDYTLKLTCLNDLSYNADEVRTFHFEISEKLWKRWWFILLSSIVIVGLSFLYFRLRQDRVVKFQKLKSDRLSSEINMLKSQINPHFLFNSFNTLISTIEEDPQRGVAFTQAMSNYYRQMLAYRDKRVIHLSEEFDILNNYFHILSVRFGFNVSLAIEGEPRQFDGIIPLTLPMIVENVIKHNKISSSFPMKIDILVDNNYVTICNPIQLKKNVETSTHFGLSSIARQYREVFNLDISISTSEDKFCVKIPIIRLNTISKIDLEK